MSKESKPNKTRIEVEPRGLPMQESKTSGNPFEELNADAAEADASDNQSGKGLVQPRNLPAKEKDLNYQDAEKMREAMRLIVEEGKDRDEAARLVRIEPLKLRHWESAYHEFLQKDLNEGDALRDSDAQLQELSDENKERFTQNWSEMMEKFVMRRVRVGKVRQFLMANPLTRWIFKNAHGELDIGVVGGVTFGLLALTFMLFFTLNKREASADPYGDQGDVTYELEMDAVAATKTGVDFLNESDLEKKAALVRFPESARAKMPDFYRRHPELRSFSHVKYISCVHRVHDGREFLLAQFLGKNTAFTSNEDLEGTAILMALENTPDGYRVDWEVTSAYQPMTWKEFKSLKPTDPIEMRVTIRAADYYNFEFDDPDIFQAYRLSYDGDDLDLFAYAPKDSESGKILDSLLELQSQLGAILKLRFPSNPGEGNQVEIVDFVQDNWFKTKSS